MTPVLMSARRQVILKTSKERIMETLMTLVNLMIQVNLMTLEISMILISMELVLKIFQEEDFKNQKEDFKQQRLGKLIMTKSQSINVMST
jgi:hypothetical protein